MKDAEYLTFDDVLLVPQLSDIASRANVDLSHGKLGLKAPIISANMDTVTEENMAIAMHNAGGMGIIHRFLSKERLLQIISRCRSAGAKPAVSIGINKDSDDLMMAAIQAAVSIYTIDVAHGHHRGVLDRIKQLRGLTSHLKDVIIIAGNVVTQRATYDLAQAGADIIKVGVGPGSMCTTRVVTGHGFPQLSAIQQCAEEAKGFGCEIIADGGIRNSGDIAKAIAAGADYVMIGKLFASAEESPGDKMRTSSGLIKQYRGMASREAQDAAKRASRTPEGVATEVKIVGTVDQIMRELKGGLASALSYSGAHNIAEFKKNAEFIRVTHNSYIEGKPHGLFDK